MTAWHTASAPGKFVILGEHSVVYGKPAVVLAADRRITCGVRRGKRNLLNGEPMEFSRQPHFRYLTRNLRHAVEFVTRSDIPTGAGLGSSAALAASVALALEDLAGNDPDERKLVDEAYGAELAAQGNGSPMDASACVHGGGIGVNIPGTERNGLWRISRNGRVWNVSDVDVPDMTFVIGNTGVRAPTGPQVDKVRRFVGRSNFASEMIEEIGNVTLSGYEALQKGDVEALGRMMTTDHKLLSILGVSCKELNKLVNAALPYSYGAKLTGSGGGGCMVALTDDPEKVASVITARGGVAYVMGAGSEGARLESSLPEGPAFDIPALERSEVGGWTRPTFFMT